MPGVGVFCDEPDRIAFYTFGQFCWNIMEDFGIWAGKNIILRGYWITSGIFKPCNLNICIFAI